MITASASLTSFEPPASLELELYVLFHKCLHTGTGGDGITVAHNVTMNLTCTAPPNVRTPPLWFVNGTPVATEGHSYRSIIIIGPSEQTSILMIDGNRTCETLNIHCEFVTVEPLKHFTMHIIKLRIYG